MKDQVFATEGYRGSTGWRNRPFHRSGTKRVVNFVNNIIGMKKSIQEYAKNLLILKTDWFMDKGHQNYKKSRMALKKRAKRYSVHKLPFATLNVKDFKKIKEIDLFIEAEIRGL